jgi:hypothetical protein
VVQFYNKRGRAEQRIKEGKQAVTMTRLGCHPFGSNEVGLWLSLIAYKGNLTQRGVRGDCGSGRCHCQPAGKADKFQFNGS